MFDARKTVKRLRRNGVSFAGPESFLDQRIAERARLAARAAKVAENGLVGVIRKHIDCDGTMSRSESVRPWKGAFPFQIERDRLYEEAEGPASLHIYPPSEVEPGLRVVRDLALEAFEDGHPHRISYAI